MYERVGKRGTVRPAALTWNRMCGRGGHHQLYATIVVQVQLSPFPSAASLAEVLACPLSL